MRVWGAAAVVMLALVALPAGAAAQSGEAETSIVRGTTAPISSFPWLAAVKYEGHRLAVSCTGTVVAPRVILTAAHCLYREGGGVFNAANFKVYTGTADLAQATTANVSLVGQALIFPSYNPNKNFNDAGLLVLSTPVSAPPLGIATPADASLLVKGTPISIAGWGLTNARSNRVPSVFRQGTTTIQDASYCKKHGPRFLTYSYVSQLCAASAPRFEVGSCQGDSGGPGIARREDGSPVEVGIISEVETGCDTRAPEILARVDYVSEWVARWIAAVESGAPSPPVKALKVALPLLSLPEAKIFAVLGLAKDFGPRFARGGDPFEIYGCNRINRSKVKCGVVWFRRGNDYYGTTTSFWAHDEDGAFPSYRYRIHWVNDRCWFHSSHRKACVIHSRGR